MRVKTALVTGASRGLGKHIADDLERRGCEVIRLDSSKYDFRNKDDVNQMIADLYFKPIDILINNAAIRHGTLAEILRANICVPNRLSHMTSDYMANNNYGRIVNISSIASFIRESKDYPDEYNFYIRSKKYLNGLTKSYAKLYPEHNVLVNAVCPAMMKTDMLKRTKLKAVVPIKEVSKLIIFLCLDNNYITGQNIIIDGGFTLENSMYDTS